MAILNKVQPGFSPERYAHQHFIFLPRTILSVERERLNECHQLSDDYEQAAWDALFNPERQSCEGNAYWTHLTGA